MRVSIIITSYNYDRFLARAIDSALAQDHPDLEVIVVDDGSTDRSREIIASYGDRIIPVLKPNGGQGSAFNAGFARSTGEIIQFLDSDDELAPSCASKVAAAMRPGVSKVHFNLLCVDEQGEPIGPFLKTPLPDGDQATELATRGSIVAIPTSGNAFSREFLDGVMPMPAQKWLTSADSYVFNLAAFAGRTAAVQETLGRYRVHGSNSSGMIRNGRVDAPRLRLWLEIEIETEAVLAEYAPRYGHTFPRGALTGSLGHLQQLFFLGKLDPGSTPTGLIGLFLRYQDRLLRANVSLIKKALIGAWSWAILIAPRPLSERLIAIAYKHGAVVSVVRAVNR